MNRLFAITLVLLATIGASTSAVAKVSVPEKLASGVFAANNAQSAPADAAASLDFAGREATCGYELVSGQSKWLSRDPIAEKGGLNLYRAFNNASMRFVDRLGMDIVPVDLYDPSLNGDKAAEAQRKGVDAGRRKYDKDKAKRFGDKLRKTLDQMKECCKKPELASLGVCKYLNDGEKHPLRITPEEDPDQGYGGTEGQDPSLTLPNNGESPDHDILDSHGQPTGSKQSLGGIVAHEFQHEYDHKHPDGTRPSGADYPSGDPNKRYKNPSEKSAVDAENAFRKHCPEVCPGPERGSYQPPR